MIRSIGHLIGNVVSLMRQSPEDLVSNVSKHKVDVKQYSFMFYSSFATLFLLYNLHCVSPDDDRMAFIVACKIRSSYLRSSVEALGLF